MKAKPNSTLSILAAVGLACLLIWLIQSSIQYHPEDRKSNNDDSQPDSSVQDLVSNEYLELQLHEYFSPEKGYFRLADSSISHPRIRPFYGVIQDFFAGQGLSITDFFVSDQHIFTEANTIRFNLFHIDGYHREKEIRYKDHLASMQRTDGLRVVTDIVGNMSGYDGSIAIDTIQKKVIEYVVWD